MIRLLSRFFLFVFSLLLFFILLWAIANEQQKTQLNTWYQLAAKPILQLGIVIPDSLLPTSIEQNKKQPPLSPLSTEHRPVICGKVKSQKIDHRYNVYQWQDANGRTQISDTAPTLGYTNLRVQELYIDNFFDLTLDSSQADLPPFTQNHIQAGVTKTYKTLSDVLKVAQLRKIDLNLKFISDKDQFHAYRRKVAPDSSNQATGFYTSRLNQATIWAVGSKNHLTRISLHESSHAIAAAMFGDTPVWLNEGMAEFFDQW